MQRTLALAALLVALTGLSACGQKGPLVLPTKPATAPTTPTPAAPAAASAAATASTTARPAPAPGSH